MKIAILTLPLHSNYGGNLQAYALQFYLKQMGHEVWIVKRVANFSFLRLIKKTLIYVLRPNSSNIVYKQKKDFINQNHIYFINKYIKPMTPPIASELGMKRLTKHFDAFVVGSDQIWREDFCRDWKKNFFLDFTKKENVKRIAYAASFGIDKWKYNKQMTLNFSRLLNRFNGISVREESAVYLCNKYLNVHAKCVIDPTMLLTPNDYNNICKAENTQESAGNFFVYMLGHEDYSEQLINKICATYKGLKLFTINMGNRDINNNFESQILPSVATWLQGFNDAKFVLTDSFHGCVFSILYNKPFIATANISGGVTRLKSLLKIFGLEDRLIVSANGISDQLILNPINWNKVNEILNNKRLEAKQFLIDAITKE